MATTNNMSAVDAEAPVNNVQKEQEQTETEQTEHHSADKSRIIGRP